MLALLSLGCGAPEPPQPERPNVLLVTLDTTRADRIGAYGYPAAHTPTLDRLATQGLLFEQAIAPVPLTLPTHSSLLTGVYPTEHGVRDNGGFTLSPEARTLAEVFQEQGYRTGAFVGSYVLDERFGLAQGFERYTGARVDQLGGVPPERRAEAVVADALAWHATLEPDDAFFAWVHFYDPHFPYDAPPPWKQRVPDAYDAEIAYSDDQLGQLLAEIEARAPNRPLLVAVTADHGDSLGEHDEQTHGNFIYQSSLHVPLLLWGDPIATRAGERIDRVVSNVDLTATLVTLAGLSRDRLPQSRLPLLTDPPGDSQRPIYVESLLPYYAHRWRALRGLVWSEHKWIDATPPELYYLAEDPDEQQNRAAQAPATLQRAQVLLHALLERHPPLPWSRAHEVDAEEAARLAALGYVSEVGVREITPEAPFDPALPDPRTRRGDMRRLEEAMELLRSSQRDLATRSPARRALAPPKLELARSLLRPVLAKNPRDAAALERLAKVEQLLGNCDAAIPLFERVLATPRGDDAHRFDLATCLGAEGESDRAVALMKEIIAREPRVYRPYGWLFRHHVKRGEFGRAAAQLREILPLLSPSSDDYRNAKTLSDWAASQTEGSLTPSPPPPPQSG